LIIINENEGSMLTIDGSFGEGGGQIVRVIPRAGYGDRARLSH